MKALKWVGGIALLIVGVIAFAAYQGHEEQRKLRAALALTGHYAGMTEDDVMRLGDRLRAENVGNITDAREVIYWVVCSGRFSSTIASKASETALRMVSVQGLSPKEAVGSLALMTGSGDPFIACPK